MWGQGTHRARPLALDRIIPTRVGTSRSFPCWFAYIRDHPHACGDKWYVNNEKCTQEGSSPRVWGQGGFHTINPLQFRIIPTRVGTSSTRSSGVYYYQDHPHACGDKIPIPIARRTKLGSSPRVWGQGRLDKTRYAVSGIIPTRVGTRLKKSRKIAVLQNQPLRFPLTFHRSSV